MEAVRNIVEAGFSFLAAVGISCETIGLRNEFLLIA